MSVNIDNLNNKKYWYRYDDDNSRALHPWIIYENKGINEKKESIDFEFACTGEEYIAIAIIEALNNSIE